MDSNYNIEITNRLYHVLCNHEKDLVIKSYVDRDTKYLEMIELKLYEHSSECPFASIFVEIDYSGRWGDFNASAKIYGKISCLEETNSDKLKLLVNHEFDNLLIKYKELKPLITTKTTTPHIIDRHSARSHTAAVFEGTRVEIKFEIQKSLHFPEPVPSYERTKLSWDKKMISCLDALKDVLNQLKSINYYPYCSDSTHHERSSY